MGPRRNLRAALAATLLGLLAACLPLPDAPGEEGLPPTPVGLAALPAEAPPAPSPRVAPPGSTGPAGAASVAPAPASPASPVPSLPVRAGTPAPSPAEQASPSPAGSVVPSAFAPPVGAEGPWPVTRVVDGDTLAVRTEAGEVTLRLIGVDTPESVHPTQPVECFGPEASAFAKGALSGQRVWLEHDASQGRLDRYGRRLAYVWLSDGTLFNDAVIRTGHAVEYTYSKPYLHQARFRAAQAEARLEARGLWGGCADGRASAPPTPSSAAAGPTPLLGAPAPAPSCPPGERWVEPYVRKDGTPVRGYCRKVS